MLCVLILMKESGAIDGRQFWQQFNSLVVSRAYRPQRGRGHVTAIHDSVPSKLQIRQWFVTNYSNSCCLDCISAMD